MNWTTACLLALICSLAPFPSAPQERAKTEELIREATFRYQFGHIPEEQRQRGKVYFLTVGGKGDDPTESLMQRFSDHKPPVKKFTLGEFTATVTILDNVTREQGILFRVKKVKWVSDTEVEVEGGWYESPKSASDNTYTLKLGKDGWTVTSDIVHWSGGK